MSIVITIVRRTSSFTLPLTKKKGRSQKSVYLSFETGPMPSCPTEIPTQCRKTNHLVYRAIISNSIHLPCYCCHFQSSTFHFPISDQYFSFHNRVPITFNLVLPIAFCLLTLNSPLKKEIQVIYFPD